MSAKGNRSLKKHIDQNFFNTFSPVSLLKKKLPLSVTHSSAKKPKTGLRKIRRTEDLLFWDVEVLPSDQDYPIGASSPIEKSKKESPKTKKKTRKSVNKSVTLGLSTLQDNSIEEKIQPEQNQVRKIVTAKRHFGHERVDILVNERGDNLKHKGHTELCELEETETVIVQSQKQDDQIQVEDNRKFTNNISAKPISNGIIEENADCLGNLDKNRRISNKRASRNVSRNQSTIADENPSDHHINQQNEDIKSLVNDSIQLSLENSIKKYGKSLPTIKVDYADHTELNSTYNRISEFTNLNKTFTESVEIAIVEKSSGIIVIHDSKSVLSPSTSNAELQEAFSFNCSQEDLHPSTSGTIDISAIKRRTFELDQSVNNISLLKSTAEKDSFRMSTLKDEQESLTDRFEQVTKRRKWEKKVDNTPKVRLSHVTPPWGSDDSTPTKTSTPISLKKSQSLFIQTLSKDPNKSNYKSKGKSTSKVKMPNFAAIHERALQKVESISDYKKRIDNRAKILLSGKKPAEQSSKKQLRFAPDTTDREKSAGFIPLPSTPLPKFKHRQSIDSPAKTSAPPTPLAKKLLRKSIGSPFSFAKQHKENKVPFHNGISKSGSNPIFFNIGATKTVAPIAIAKKKVKEFEVLGGKISKPVPKEISSFNTRLPRPMVHSKKDEIKTMITAKTKQNVESKTKKRAEIKGVRSNRRFDLLMNMRKGK